MKDFIGTEKQIAYATKLIADLTARMLNHGMAGGCETTRAEDANCMAFLDSLTDDAGAIIEAMTAPAMIGFKIDISDIRDCGAGVWEEVEAMATKRPTAYRLTMAMRGSK